MLLLAALMLQFSAIILLIMYVQPGLEKEHEQWSSHSSLVQMCIVAIVIGLIMLSLLVCMHAYGNEIGTVVALVALGLSGMLVTLLANLMPGWLDVCMPLSLTATLLLLLLSAPMMQWV